MADKSLLAMATRAPADQHIEETPKTYGFLSFLSSVRQRTRSWRRRYRGARADQHRQDASGDRADARAFLRRNRAAAAAAGARGLQQGRRPRGRGFRRADYRRGKN